MSYSERVAVNNAAPVEPAKILGLEVPVFYGTIAGIIIVSVVGAIMALMRTRRHQNSQPMERISSLLPYRINSRRP